MKQFTSETQKIGLLGEKIATEFLTNKGFSIIDRNYTKKIGEIDIVAKRNKVIHFIEVKAIVKRNTNVSRGTIMQNKDVSRETLDIYNPFQNVTPHKLRKFSRTVEWYLAEKHVSRETSWQIDAISVILDYETRKARVEVLWNIIA
jgi:putative endonuclease